MRRHKETRKKKSNYLIAGVDSLDFADGIRFGVFDLLDHTIDKGAEAKRQGETLHSQGVSS